MIGSKILLVDDEVIFARNMETLLDARGYRSKAVTSGAEAVRALETEDFDVVVLDLKMPGMDGLTTLKEIKKLGLFTQILILTGHGSIDSALEAIKLGAYDYLTKPCQISEMVEKIEGAWEIKDDLKRQDSAKKTRKPAESPRDAKHGVADSPRPLTISFG